MQCAAAGLDRTGAALPTLPHCRTAHPGPAPFLPCPCPLQRDLKPQNLLLSEAVPEATLKIADFGFARNLQPQVGAWAVAGWVGGRMGVHAGGWVPFQLACPSTQACSLSHATYMRSPTLNPPFAKTSAICTPCNVGATRHAHRHPPRRSPAGPG